MKKLHTADKGCIKQALWSTSCSCIEAIRVIFEYKNALQQHKHESVLVQQERKQKSLLGLIITACANCKKSKPYCKYKRFCHCHNAKVLPRGSRCNSGLAIIKTSRPNCKRNTHSALFSVVDAVVAVALATVVANLLTEAP